LIERGYPLQRSDLYLETWTDLVVIENVIAAAVKKKSQSNTKPPPTQPKKRP
jgi:hypothetical protein